ncbi:MAG: ROK family protein [Saprospiraceae bacterium]|nr:ROK family protein [Saprospiraceae bacterium]MCF8251191.1 ROK family protein [Saprospiraceae bacterium]MCF8282376.1 ROK family protein [Bacteroidales bacterium]MCF8313003.1 ROK family protein [Saprospiraceae bacterium]MCF8441450.1 ROK family protein [Saprospiraceae bacterium]
MESKKILGIDVGASGIKGAIVDLETGGLATERVKLSTPKPATPEAVARVVAELVNKTGYTGDIIGCGFPAIVKHGVAYSAANVDPAWIGANIETLLSEATGKKVVAVNDADAAGIAEMHFGKGKGKKGTVVLITIGSGLGSALFLDGHLVPNSEFGHLYLHGMVAEHYVSNTARKKYEMSWSGFGKRFNEYLLHLDRIFSPDLVILGGGISNEFDQYSGKLDKHLNVTTAAMFNHAGIIGAALNAFETVFGENREAVA